MNLDYKKTAERLAKRAMTHPNPQERERLRLLSAAAELLARQQQKAAYFARRAQHYEQMAQSEPEESQAKREALYLADSMQKRYNLWARQNSLTPPDCEVW